jgi:hypothetical protein
MTMSRALIGAAATLAVATATLIGAEARACGGLFSSSQSSDVAVMSDIRVLLVQRGGDLHQFVQVGYSGNARSFAWIYPVAGNPQVAEADGDLFVQLEEGTRPEITTYADSGGGGAGCGSADDGAAGLDDRQIDVPPVTVWKQGQVGAFDYVVLTATTAQDLLDWLNQNGFTVPAATESVAGHYLALGWYFVAMKVSVDAIGDGVPSTTTIRLSYPADEVRYPLKMVSLSPAPETSLELYLISESSQEELAPEAPFSARTLDREYLAASSETEHNYPEAFQKTLDDAGPRGLVREFSSRSWHVAALPGEGISSSGALTRYRTTFGPDAMDQDIVFTPAPYDELLAKYQLEHWPNRRAAAPLALVLAVGVWWVARRLRPRRP